MNTWKLNLFSYFLAFGNDYLEPYTKMLLETADLHTSPVKTPLVTSITKECYMFYKMVWCKLCYDFSCEYQYTI